MKKIYSLAAFLGLAVLGNAQSVAPAGPVNPGKTFAPLAKHPHLIQKSSSRATERWYNYGETMDNYMFSNNGINSELNANLVFPDTTILVDYGTSGYSGPWIHALGDVLDVTSQFFNDPVLHNGELFLTSQTPYRVDSVGFMFIYDRNINDPAIVDTLIFEVGVNGTSSSLPTYLFGPTSQVSINLGTDTTYFKGMKYTYTTNSLNHTGKKTYKVALDENTYADSTASGLHYVEVATPDLPNVNANMKVAMSVKFKPGYTWIANYDTLAGEFENKNSVRFLSFEEQSNSYPIYVKRDYNVSYIVPQDVRYNVAGSWNGFYIPSFAYMGSSPSYAYEHHLMYYKVSTNLTGVENAANNGTALFQNEPNPFNRTTTIRYTLASSENVKMTIHDVTGRIVKTVNEGNVGAGSHSLVLDASEFNKGVYFYTLTVGGKSMTKRMVIAD